MSAFKKHKKSYAILLVNLLLLVIGIVLYRETEQVLKANNEERLLTKINLHIDSVLISLKDAQRGERGYVISGNKAYLKAFYNARKRLSGLVGDLETALNTQKDIQKRFVTSERWMANALSKFDEIIKTREEEGAVLETLAKKDYEGKLFIDTLQNTIQAIEKYEKEKLDNDAQKAIASLEEIVTLLALSGIVVFVIVILLSTSLVRDILKREELTLKLEGSEKRYHFLFELSADGIIVADLNGIITDCNNAACKIFGYSKQELMGKSYHIIFPDEQKHLLPAKISRDTVTGDRLIERTYVKKDGTILNAEVYTKLIEINGLSNVVAHIRDITDKKQAQKAIAKSEEKYRNLFEKSLAGIFKATIEGQIIECNNEYLKVLGYDSIENIKKISTKSLYADPKDREKLVELLRKQREVKDYVMKLKKKDGSYVWVYDSVSLMYDEDLKKEVLFGTMVDITAQKEAEKEIRMLAHSLESINECVSITDANNIILYVNNSFVKTYGYSKEELIGRDVSIVQPQSQEVPDIQSNVLNLTKKGGWKGELINKRKDGSEFPIYLSTSIVKDSENNALALIGVATDITERKLAEEEIYRLNRIYTVLSNINQAIVRIKDKNQMLNTACKIAIDDGKFKMSWIGLIDEQANELKVAASYGLINGYLDDVILNKELYPNNIKPISELITTGKALIFNDIEKLDSNLFWRQYALNLGYKSNVVFPLKVFGKVIGNYSLFSDQIGFFEEKEIRLLEEMSENISFALETMEIEKKRKESELLFYTLADNSPVGIFRTREDGYTTYVNPKWCQLAGMKAVEALGDGWLKAVHRDDRKIIAEEWKKAAEEKRQSIAEYRFVRADGSTSWVMGQAIPELNSEGQIEGYVGTITDITNIKLYEHELIKAKETAESSERIKSEFLAQMSHEIRTPINVIVSSTSYLKDELEDKIEHELFSIFNSVDCASKRIIRTMDLILNMAEIQTNSYHSSQVELNLSGKFLTNIYNEFITDAKEKNLEFNLHCKTADANIYADEYSVKKIFVHLIDNAIKYTPEGKVDLTVDKDAEGKIFVSIADTGIGMSNEFMAMMYNPFTQEEQGYSRRFEGNGLGLALVKKYCDLNNATITVESAKGKGTVFTIKF